MRRQAKQKLSGGILVATVVLPVVTFFGGMFLNAFSIAQNIATKPYVDDKALEGKRYTDEKSAQTLKDAFEHSDANRQNMMIEIGKFGAVQQAQGVKIDMVLENIRSMQEFERKRK